MGACTSVNACTRTHRKPKIKTTEVRSRMGDSKRAWDDGDNDFSNAATTRYEETHQSRTMQQSASTPVLPGYAAAAYATPKKVGLGRWRV
mgnify:FL=1